MLDTERRKPGRPPLPARPDQKTTLSLRIASGLKRQLVETGQGQGRNLSNQAEIYLETAGHLRGLLADTLTLETGTTETAGLALLLVRTLTMISARAAIAAELNYDAVDRRLANAYAYDQLVLGLNEVVEAFRPAGPVEFPATGTARMLPIQDPANYGRFVAASLLRAAADPDGVNAGLPEEQCNFERERFARKAAELLGSAIVKNMKAKCPDPFEFVKGRPPPAGPADD